MIKYNRLVLSLTIISSITSEYVAYETNQLSIFILSNIISIVSYSLLIVSLLKERALGPIKSCECEDNRHLIEALVAHIKKTDKENLYKGSELETIINKELWK